MWLLHAGACRCRGMVMPGETAWLYLPYQIPVLSSGLLWSLLLDIRCLWYDITAWCFIFANQRFCDVCWHNMHIMTQHAYYTLHTRNCTMCHCNEHEYQCSKSGHRSKTQHSMLRQSSPQLQEYPATRWNRGVEDSFMLARFTNEKINLRSLQPSRRNSVNMWSAITPGVSG